MRPFAAKLGVVALVATWTSPTPAAEYDNVFFQAAGIPFTIWWQRGSPRFTLSAAGQAPVRSLQVGDYHILSMDYEHGYWIAAWQAEVDFVVNLRLDSSGHYKNQITGEFCSPGPVTVRISVREPVMLYCGTRIVLLDRSQPSAH